MKGISSIRLWSRLIGTSLAVVFSNGCTLEVLSGPSRVEVGDTVTYVTQLSSMDGNHDVHFFYYAEVPLGWRLESAQFQGTLDGVYTFIDGTRIETARPPMQGYQLYGFRSEIFELARSRDTGQARLTFHVEDQPDEEYRVFFEFGGWGTVGDWLSRPGVWTINRREPGPLNFREVHFDDRDGVDGLKTAIAVAASPDGLFVYVASRDEDAIAIFARDPISGDLTFSQTIVEGQDGVEGLNAPRGLAISEDGLFLYVAAELSSSVAVFARDLTTGALTPVQVLFDDVGEVDGIGNTRTIELAPDGAHAYAVSFVEHAIATFARNPTTGELTFIEALFASPDVGGLVGANTLDFSPDGASVYVGGDDSVAVFDRDPISGELSFVEALYGEWPGEPILESIRAVVVSPDGRHVYVASRPRLLDSIVIYARDQGTGELSFIESLYNRDDTAGGLGRPTDLAFSANSEQLFATSDISVAVLERAPETGLLTLLEAEFDADPSEQQGLVGVNALAVAADGHGADSLYVVSGDDHAVVTFELVNSTVSVDLESWE